MASRVSINSKSVSVFGQHALIDDLSKSCYFVNLFGSRMIFGWHTSNLLLGRLGQILNPPFLIFCLNSKMSFQKFPQEIMRNPLQKMVDSRFRTRNAQAGMT